MKILIDLNRNEQITMVMVTHDIALKNYASKIIRMSDGRVANIKYTPENELKESY